MKSHALTGVVVTTLLAAIAYPQGRTVGSFSVTRNVTYSLSGSDNFLVANPHDGVRDGSLVRTGKRAFGEIVFHDSSVLRINERTDLVVHDSPSLRNIQLNAGAVWVKVKKGTHTAVQTPVGTATARGTVFLVGSSGYLHVLEGTVELADPDSKGVLLVHEGETALIGFGGVPQMADPAGGEYGADLDGTPGKEGFPQNWYLSQGELFGSYTDAGGTDDQAIVPPIFLWQPFAGIGALATGILFHGGGRGIDTGGGGKTVGGDPGTPEPGTMLIIGGGLVALSRAKRRSK